ncbi:hypothetical protein AB0469_18480 [Streptomyces sp. NPDC093801]|uniref:hypothetical protein n=1 Tax=Streptomyces sp. NPDC093801 TaxID=3155203 RepID=UPI00344DB7C2
MSRTAHHVPHHRTPHGIRLRSLRGVPWGEYPRNHPERSHTLTGLRYTPAELARAGREGRRPRPAEVGRSFAVYAYCCAWIHRSRYVKTAAALDERAARARLRTDLRKALFDEEADIRPVRHRHGAHDDF